MLLKLIALVKLNSTENYLRTNHLESLIEFLSNPEKLIGQIYNNYKDFNPKLNGKAY